MMGESLAGITRRAKMARPKAPAQVARGIGFEIRRRISERMGARGVSESQRVSWSAGVRLSRETTGSLGSRQSAGRRAHSLPPTRQRSVSGNE